MSNCDDVLRFWFEEAGPKNWFRGSAEFDALCEERFSKTLEAAKKGELWTWRVTPEGRCAEIILLDQISRNVYRGSSQAFAQDGMALVLAQEAVAGGDDQRMIPDQRYFTYMPYMHSESLAVHDEALRLFEGLDNPEALRYEVAHRDVIKRFGRYPARNMALDRESTPEELDHLATHRGF